MERMGDHRSDCDHYLAKRGELGIGQDRRLRTGKREPIAPLLRRIWVAHLGRPRRIPRELK